MPFFRNRIPQGKWIVSKVHQLVGELMNCEITVDRFFFAPVVVGVAFEAASFGGVATGTMAVAAGLNSGDQDVRGFLALERLGVTRGARHHLMRFMIEVGVRQPARSDHGFGDFGERVETGWIARRVALFAGFAPQ